MPSLTPTQNMVDRIIVISTQAVLSELRYLDGEIATAAETSELFLCLTCLWLPWVC